ncbi:hypothetical protein [Litchfieldia salsa]|uniref:DUF3951 domain-containing protein n=1 Tax=Litchfieldia salsa TaxID=930152 RepID=A0A1H0SXC5_9BACI|nr:hypothetical protein [Litchfieldia salsa]SDP46200.1 hypothetical protein SAMN05216565_103161 [Litchfieldia salsa]
MAYAYTLFVISVIGLIIVRMTKRKSRASNRYTPYDDITIGHKNNVKWDRSIEDSKHEIHYEEKIENDKTVKR